MIYIPFWLNLYGIVKYVKEGGNEFTFHSG